MNHLRAFQRSVRNISLAAVLMPGLLGILAFVLFRETAELSLILSLILAISVYAAAVAVAFINLTKVVMLPVEKVWQAVWHVSPGKTDVPAPKLENLRLGRDLVNALVLQVYDLASHGQAIQEATGGGQAPAATGPVVQADGIIESIPTPLFFVDKEKVVKMANSAALNYIGLPREKVIGRYVYDVLRMSFMSDDTLEAWMDSQNKAIDSRSWEHARLTMDDNKTVKQFDLAASFSKDRSDGLEMVLALFDRTSAYDKQDAAIGYVAMAVHELRTPLTIMRGYIEVFEDELGQTLSQEHQEFMRKMSASAQSLTAFVSNILNVARIDQNQFMLTLHEANWNEVLPQIIKDMEIRASVRGKTLELELAPNLPSVAIDRISIYEVVSNLVDNAIKYSGQNTRILIKSGLGKDGNIETVVQDFGVGMPPSVIDGLFTRYYRSHRSKNAVSGSGLGLYLVKAIVDAHGGNVWVNSKEGEGSSFGFSILPYANLADKPQVAGQDGIERQASGWIKNHSMYRR